MGMNQFAKRIGLLSTLACCAFVLAACSRTVTWKEEVQLSDGRMIVIERETLRAGGGDDLAHGGSGSRPKERRIRFTYPEGSGQVVEWRSTKFDSATWPEDPLVLDIEAGQPIVLSIVPISDACEIYSKYLYRNAAWIEEPLSEEFEKRVTNLYLKSGPDMPRFVSLETKRKENADVGYRPRLKQVGPKRMVCGA